MYMILRVLLDTLSTFLDPFLDGLLGHDPCSVEGGIKANVLVFDDPGAWLLQYPSLRYLDAVKISLTVLASVSGFL